jgi:hypothetical protein
MTTRGWVNDSGLYRDGLWTDDANWSPTGAPQAGDTAVIEGGTVGLANAVLSGLTIELAGPATRVPTLDINNVTFGQDTTLQVPNFIPTPFELVTPDGVAEIHASGRNRNDGTIETAQDQGASATLRIDVADGPGPHGGFVSGRFINSGTLHVQPESDLVVQGDGPRAVLRNDGLIDTGGTVTLNLAVLGLGTIRLERPLFAHGGFGLDEVSFTNRVGSGQTVAFNGGGVARIGDLQDFHAVLSGFAAPDAPGLQERIDLPGRDISAVEYNGDQNGGVLTLFAGNRVAGTLTFAGDYTDATFVLGHTVSGITTTSTIALQPPPG